MTAAFCIHSQIHAQLGRRAAVVMHTHQPAATAISALKLAPTSSGAAGSLVLGGRRCAVDPVYMGIVNEPGEGLRIAKVLAANPAASTLLMGNHGVTVIAGSVADAVHELVQLEVAAIQYRPGPLPPLGPSSSHPADNGSAPAAVLASRCAVAVYRDTFAEEAGLEPWWAAGGSLPPSTSSPAPSSLVARPGAAAAYFDEQRARPENGCVANAGGWDGRGAFPKSRGIGGDDDGGGDMAAAAGLLAGMLPDVATGLLSVAGPEGAAVPPANKIWGVSGAGTVSAARAASIAARLHSRHGPCGKAVLVAALPAGSSGTFATQMAGMPGCDLLPIVQDAMLFHGHTAVLPCSAGATAGIEADDAAALLDVELAKAAAVADASGKALRIAVGPRLVIAIGNSAAHVHSLVDRYTKAACVQLLALATGRPLAMIRPEIIAQKQNAFLCAPKDPKPKSSQMHLDALKRLQAVVLAPV